MADKAVTIEASEDCDGKAGIFLGKLKLSDSIKTRNLGCALIGTFLALIFQ